ncbi:MAG TPA: hypothetical protein VEO56_03715 [Bacteroidota bacterium]|nr:hypothetical protein [Bacteroidota bacterium]
MTPGRNAVTWSCICSSLFMGCYGQALIDPRGDEKARIYSERIEYVILKDSTRCDFDRPPFVGRDFIVGQVNGEQKSIPISDVKVAGASRANGIAGLIVVVGVTAAVSWLIFEHNFRIGPVLR